MIAKIFNMYGKVEDEEQVFTTKQALRFVNQWDKVVVITDIESLWIEAERKGACAMEIVYPYNLEILKEEY